MKQKPTMKSTPPITHGIMLSFARRTRDTSGTMTADQVTGRPSNEVRFSLVVSWRFCSVTLKYPNRMTAQSV